MVLGYAENGDCKNWINKNYGDFTWVKKLDLLYHIIIGLKVIHQKQIVHRDFHTGNILLGREYTDVFISDMGLCREVHDIDQNNIYGVIPYVAPEVLKRKSYTQAADIYSLGMIMYFIATGRQPFADYAHDETLVLNICNGIRPEINVPEAPKFYIDLMKRCWNQNPEERPEVIECFNLVLYSLYNNKEQLNEAEEYRISHISSEKNRQSTHTHAIYTSRLLNPITNNLPKYDNIDNNSIEATDFME
jgi:serine/threonine protein kinase